MKITNVQGDLTDISVKKEPLKTALVVQVRGLNDVVPTRVQQRPLVDRFVDLESRDVLLASSATLASKSSRVHRVSPTALQSPPRQHCQ